MAAACGASTPPRSSGSWAIASPRLRQSGPLDIGKGFDLVAGTSTGAIVAAGIAAGIPMAKVATLYEKIGPRDIPDVPCPPIGPVSPRWRDRARFLSWGRPECSAVSAGSNEELASALRDIFGTMTMGQIYERRGIGLAISATRLLQHSPRSLQDSPHISSKDRDDDLSVVDACLASSAAPIYLPLASITEDGIEGQIFVDGGLWANNPDPTGPHRRVGGRQTHGPANRHRLSRNLLGARWR